MFQNLIDLFFPHVCEACRTVLSDNEKVICTSCRHELPITNFHFENNDAIKNILYGRVKLENGTALLHFSKKGLVQEMLHNLKYRGHEQVGDFFGNWLGAELKTIEAYKRIDIVVAVPMHQSKRRERGYNQVTKFGMRIAQALQVDYEEDALVKIKQTKTQVFKDRLTRSDTANARFKLGNIEHLKRKHILLVDDIITTGATIEECASLLKSISGVKISLATMAIAE
ncbi:MAG: ComF family protein [Winogradskyella sp.]|uniref:ComF family protein n=1 Tax=Winogradskyella sp. TaxID=1883156 RepID=UPI000F3C9357|nr:phosphoribosyltransferase family protein [Winogradskyella sp.]RNC87833.1 MAG: ComF family protein [Winogradskyella sp.]